MWLCGGRLIQAKRRASAKTSGQPSWEDAGSGQEASVIEQSSQGEVRGDEVREGMDALMP
jgi:hypothetical protein